MASFLDLPGEIRNMIYKQLLTLEDPINFLQESRLETAILYTNRTIHRESSSLLYAQNCFDFVCMTYKLVSQFLGQIGPGNAGYIHHIRIHLPVLRNFESTLALDDDSVCMLAKLQSDCINLRTITMGPANWYDLMLKWISYTSPEIVTRTLLVTITRLREFTNVERIIGEVYDYGPSSFIRDEMISLGWVVRTVEPPEDWDDDRHSLDFDEDGYYLEDGFSGDDGYDDIDNK